MVLPLWTLLLLLQLVVAAPLQSRSMVQPRPRQGGPSATIYSNCITPNTVAVTLDDGPYIYESDAAQFLTDQGVKATFFINGNNWACVYDSDMMASLQQAYNAGHQIASHTWQHLDLTTLDWDDIHNQMWLTEQAMERIIGASPAFFRPPYGNYNDLVLQAAYIRNQSAILWSFDSGDSTGSTVAQSESAYDDLVWNQHPSDIIALNHETYSNTVYDLLPYAISDLQSAGYKFATIAECLGMEPYQWTAAPQTPDSSWGC